MNSIHLQCLQLPLRRQYHDRQPTPNSGKFNSSSAAAAGRKSDRKGIPNRRKGESDEAYQLRKLKLSPNDILIEHLSTLKAKNDAGTITEAGHTVMIELALKLVEYELATPEGIECITVDESPALNNALIDELAREFGLND